MWHDVSFRINYHHACTIFHRNPLRLPFCFCGSVEGYGVYVTYVLWWWFESLGVWLIVRISDTYVCVLKGSASSYDGDGSCCCDSHLILFKVNTVMQIRIDNSAKEKKYYGIIRLCDMA